MRGKKAAVFCAVILICAAVLRLYLGNKGFYGSAGFSEYIS